MHESNKLIESLYASFQKKDWKGMQACYHDRIHFSDPVFRNLNGLEVKAMWHMLTAAAKDLTVSYQNIKSDDTVGSCDWDAHYSFSKTGRKVHNIIHANFEFSEGKIIRHTDTFDLWRWSGMALGTSGKLLGWTSLIQSKIRQSADSSLRKFIHEHPEYQA